MAHALPYWPISCLALPQWIRSVSFQTAREEFSLCQSSLPGQTWRRGAPLRTARRHQQPQEPEPCRDTETPNTLPGAAQGNPPPNVLHGASWGSTPASPVNGGGGGVEGGRATAVGSGRPGSRRCGQRGESTNSLAAGRERGGQTGRAGQAGVVRGGCRRSPPGHNRSFSLTHLPHAEPRRTARRPQHTSGASANHPRRAGPHLD